MQHHRAVLGHTKHIDRRVLDDCIISLLARLPKTLSTVSLSLIRNWTRVSWQYIDAYACGLEGYVSVKDAKKHLGHRRASDRGNAALLATSTAQTAEERKAKEEAALVAAREAPAASLTAAHAVLRAFNAWASTPAQS